VSPFVPRAASGYLVALLFVMGLPPLAAQLLAPVPRLDSDAVEYFSHVRSLYFDHDLDFADEFRHFGILERGDKVRPTPTGHRRTIFSVGPALLWMPFYAAGDLVARAEGEVEDGYSRFHIRAVSVASWFYGLSGLVLVYLVLETVVARPTAFLTTFLLLYATFLFWYMVHEAAMSHAVSFFMAAVVLAAWWPVRGGFSLARGILLGLLIGLAAMVRWQNGVLLLLPGLTLAGRLRGAPLWAVGGGLLTLTGFAAGALPQMLAWRAIFGSFLLADPPHGRDFLRLDHPYLLNTLFSSRHGLLFWTPVLWGAFLGYVGLLRRDKSTASILLAPLLIMSYVNACSGDWWAGGSFSNRRFDSVLPLLALGLAVSLEWMREGLARRPGRALLVAGALLVAWNVALERQYRDARWNGGEPTGGSFSFARATGASARFVSETLGTPLAWPANWIFAGQHRLSPGRYDLMVGLYLFYRQNNLGGVIDVGDARTDAALFDGDWGSRVSCGAETCRELRGRGRVFAPLDVPEALDLAVAAAGVGRLTVEVNGARVGEFSLGTGLERFHTRLPSTAWRRELNEIVLEVSPGGEARIDRLTFERMGGGEAWTE
jgi:hypothetical protein